MHGRPARKVKQAATGRVVSVGEVLLDLASWPAGTPLAHTGRLEVLLGGSPSNVAVGLARLGVPASLLAAVGQDALGDWVLRRLAEERVDASHVACIPGHRTGLVFLSIDAAGNREFLHARESTADSHIFPAMVTPALLDGAAVVHHSSGPLKQAHGRAMLAKLHRQARLQGIPITVDANLRPGMWKSAEANAQAVWASAKDVDLFKANLEEAQLLTGEKQLGRALAAMRRHARQAAIITLGPEGAVVLGAGKVMRVAAPVAKVVDTTGAGDAFMAGLLAVLAAAPVWDDALLLRAARLGVKLGTRVCTRLGACTALPEREMGRRWLARA